MKHAKYKKLGSRHHYHSVMAILIVVLLFLAIGYPLVRFLAAKKDASASGAAIFPQTSFWNTRLPRFTPEDPSASLRQAVLANTSGAQIVAGARAYTVPANSTTVGVSLKDCDTGVIIGPIPEWLAVPIPDGATPSSGGEMTVYQPSTLTLWEFGNMEFVAGQWRACSGGRIENTNTSNGVYALPYGLTKSGLSRSGGQVSQAEVQTGRIDHAIGLAVPGLSNNAVWPASGSNGGGQVPAGTRLQLDPTLDLNSLSLTPLARSIARAAQLHGFVVWDSATSPSVHVEGVQAQLSNFPWDKLHVLPPNYGQNGIQPQISLFAASKTTIISGETVTFSWAATNVDSCTVPNVFSGLGAAGTYESPPIVYPTNFSLVCGGVAGSASREVSISTQVVNNNLPQPVLAEGVVFVPPPVAGKLTVLPEFVPMTELERVYKVEYFKNARLIDTVIDPPYAFDTTRLADGEHQLELKIYYRGGDFANKPRRVQVANGDERFAFAPPPASSSRPINKLLAFGVGTLLLGVAAVSVRHGMRLARTD